MTPHFAYTRHHTSRDTDQHAVRETVICQPSYDAARNIALSAELRII